jgi:hypothetical protein
MPETEPNTGIPPEAVKLSEALADPQRRFLEKAATDALLWMQDEPGRVKTFLEMQERADRSENALKWVRWLAGMHWLGQAFDPEHMRSIANLAAGALNGEDQPDHDEATAQAREKGRKMLDEMSQWIDKPEQDVAEHEGQP